MKFSCILAFSIISTTALAQQSKDTAVLLKEVIITGIKTVRGTGHLPQVKDGIIYAGKKNEVIIVDSLDANKAINNTRQILGRIPGPGIIPAVGRSFYVGVSATF